MAELLLMQDMQGHSGAQRGRSRYPYVGQCNAEECYCYCIISQDSSFMVVHTCLRPSWHACNNDRALSILLPLLALAFVGISQVYGFNTCQRAAIPLYLAMCRASQDDAGSTTKIELRNEVGHLHRTAPRGSYMFHLQRPASRARPLPRSTWLKVWKLKCAAIFAIPYTREDCSIVSSLQRPIPVTAEQASGKPRCL